MGKHHTHFAGLYFLFVLGMTSAPARAGFVYDQCRGMYDRGILCLNQVSGDCEVGQKLHVCLRRVKNCLVGTRYLPEVSRAGTFVRASLGGTPTLFSVGRYRGMGAWGVVYDISVVDFHRELMGILPQLFFGGLPRNDLAAKFVRKVRPSEQALWRETVSLEQGQFEKIQGAFRSLRMEPIPSSDILDFEEEPEPFLIKSQLNEVVDFGDAHEEDGTLSEEKLQALKRDIYDKGKEVFMRAGLTIDLGATNLFWDEKRRRWGLFELSYAVPSAFSLLYAHDHGFEHWMIRTREFWSSRNGYINDPIPAE